MNNNNIKFKLFSLPSRQALLTAGILIFSLIIFIIAFLVVRPPKEELIPGEDFAEYDKGKVVDILSDDSFQDQNSENSYRGSQLLLIEVTTGRYKGETLQVYNYVGPLYSTPLKIGDPAVMIISTYADGTHLATIFEYDRAIPLIMVISLFVIAALLVGGKTGAKSLLTLLFTLATLLGILIPALMKGAPTLLTVFFCCTYIAIVCLTVIGGLQTKSLGAMMGTISGTAIALLFGYFSQTILRIDGMRTEEAEALLQLKQMGIPIEIKGLLVAGVAISSLGAVMDVTMGISSSIHEIFQANPALSKKELFRSGMNVGKDMVGTMTNTLVLALLGSSFVLIIYLYSLGLTFHQFISSTYLSIEVISSISSSIGVILSIPLTAAFTSLLLTNKNFSQ